MPFYYFIINCIDFISFYLEKLQVDEQIKSKVSEEKEYMLDEGSVELKTANLNREKATKPKAVSLKRSIKLRNF